MARGAPPPALAAFRGLTKHIVNKMNIKGGPVAMVLASLYKAMAAKKNSGATSMDIIKAAQKMFDDDSDKNRKALHTKAEKLYKEKRAAKKAKKAAKC